MKYSEPLIGEALRLRRERPGTSWEQLADYVRDRYGVLVTGNALRKACASYAAMQDRLTTDGTFAGDFLIPFVEEYTDFITLPYADSLVVSDPHNPFFHVGLAEKSRAIAERMGLRRLFVIGDLFDAKAYSRFPTANNMSQTDGEYELEVVASFLSSYAKTVSDIYICIGNHEMRMINKLDRKLQFKTLLRSALAQAELGQCLVHVTDYPRILMRGRDAADTWLGHPESYSRIPGRVPSRLCGVHQANIVTGHTHHLGVSMHESGKYYAMETGCLTDPTKHEYLAMSFTDLPRWQPGFGMIKNERPYVFDDGLVTDWSYWLPV